MDTVRMHYALALIKAGLARVVSVTDRFVLLSERYVVASPDGATFALTDRGKDKLARKGK